MKRLALGLALVVAIGAAASLGAYALTGSDNGAKGTGEGTPTRPTGMTKCRPEAPDCEQQARENGGKTPDASGGGGGVTATCLPGTVDCNDTPDTPIGSDGSGAGAAGSCAVGTDCNDTPDTPTAVDGSTGSAPSSLGLCVEGHPDCVDTAVVTTSTEGGE